MLEPADLAGSATPDRPATEPWIGIEDAARHLAIPVRTLYRLAQSGAVPAVKVGRTWRFRRSLLDAHLAGPLHPSPRATSRRVAPARSVTIAPAPSAPDTDTDERRFLAALGELALEIGARSDPTGVGEAVTARLCELLDVDLAGIGERSGDGLVARVATRGTSGSRLLPIPRAAARSVDRVLEEGEPVQLDDFRRLPLAARSVTRMLGIRSALIVPVRDGPRVWGILGAATRTRRLFDERDRGRLEAVAAQVSLALTNARLLAEAHRWSEHLEGIEALSRELNRSRAGDEVGDAVAREIDSVISWDGVRFYVLEPDGETLEAVTLRARVPYYADETPELVRLRLGEGLGGHIALSGQAEIIPDVLRDPRMQDIPGTEDVDESMVVVPLVFEDEVLGVLEVSRLGIDAFEPTDLRLLQIIGAQAAVALANARRVEALERQARTDPLTGLPNRALFIERLDQAIARRDRIGGALAVLFLDLDGFKLVNDGLGHAAGDQLLAAVGERLRRTLRAADTVARLGGDEFAVLLEDIRDDEQPLRAAERVADALRAPLRLAARLVQIRSSIGIVIDAGQAASADELLRNADVAMYRAKANGRGRFAVFEPAMHAVQLGKLELEGELRVAIERGEFGLRFQPIVHLAAGRLAALEALLRWDHPDRGTVSPLDFVPLAEETGQIVPIGAWVLREACRQLGHWRRDGQVEDDVRISVNLSTRQLQDDAFLGEVEAALVEADLDPDALILEITESVMLVDDSAAVGVLQALRRHGVHVALDDFGTGYSSLGYLKSLPADGIKIDRSFIDGLAAEREKTAIVEAAITFAHALDLSVTAEGIETDGQLAQLVALGCDLGQGYRFSGPLPATDLEAILRDRTLLTVPPRSATPAA